jgi:hypothetical protein
MSTKALKLVVAGLLVMVVGLLLTVRKLSQQVRGNPEDAAVETVAQAPLAPPAAAAEPAPATEGRKPSPIQTRRPVTRPRSTQVAQEPAPAPGPAQGIDTKPAPAASPVALAAPEPEPAPEPRPELPKARPAPQHVTIPAGTLVVIRTQNTLSTDRNFNGDTFAATLDQPLVVDGFVIAERGAEVEGHVVRSEKAGRVEGLSDLAVELVRLHTSDGQRLSIVTEPHEVRGQKTRGSDAKKVGIGAGLGAIIGAIAGGGKGAAIGAGAGGAAGGGAVLATRGEPAVIPSESRLTFHLRTPVEVTERR